MMIADEILEKAANAFVKSEARKGIRTLGDNLRAAIEAYEAESFIRNKACYGSENEKRLEFEDLARPLIKWLNDNHNPHTTLIITTRDAEVLSGEMVFSTNEYLKG